jgi:hypothetical protein
MRTYETVAALIVPALCWGAGSREQGEFVCCRRRSSAASYFPRKNGLVVNLGGSCDDWTGVELADDQVDHRDEVAVGAVPAGAAFGGLDQ